MNQEDPSKPSNKSADLKLPALSPNSSMKSLSRPYPVTKVSLIPPGLEQKSISSSESYAQFRPIKIYSNISNVSLKKLRDSQLNLSRRSQSPFYLKRDEQTLTEILGAPKQLHLKSYNNGSISIERDTHKN
jgi:hypothetical protein